MPHDTQQPIAIPAGAPPPLRRAWDIEPEWDFLWVQASSDGGGNWITLVNAETTSTHDSGWIGSLRVPGRPGRGRDRRVHGNQRAYPAFQQNNSISPPLPDKTSCFDSGT